MKFKLNDYIIEYEVIRKDNKNLYFRFDDNCRLIITAPRFVTDKEVQKLISKNAQELLLMYENYTFFGLYNLKYKLLLT